MTRETAYKIGKWIFTPSRNEISGAGKILRLEDRAGRALEFLCQKAGTVISKEELIEHVWQGRHLSEQSVPVVISHLRKTFTDGGEQREIIETIPKRGYRVIEAKLIQSNPTQGMEKKWLGAAIAAAVVFLLGFYFLQGVPTEARKPGVVLTLNDITNSTGDEALMSQVIAMSEAGSNFLSRAESILLIRHWWNVEADDPTGGIFERYGDDAPIYHVSGTLIKEGENLAVTLFLNNPRTDEVLWSESYVVEENRFMAAHLSNLGKVLAVLGISEQIEPPGFEGQTGEAVTAYWLGLYLWQLGTEGAALDADRLWRRALENAPDFEAAKLGIRALQARWPGLFPGAGEGGSINPNEGDAAGLVLSGAIALYQDDDPEKAALLARKAIAASPNDFAAYALLAECLVRAGNIEEGLKAIREARLLAPFSSVYPEREAQFSEMLEGGD